MCCNVPTVGKALGKQSDLSSFFCFRDGHDSDLHAGLFLILTCRPKA